MKGKDLRRPSPNSISFDANGDLRGPDLAFAAWCSSCYGFVDGFER